MTLRVVVTAGGTREPIDDVRHIRNVATGSFPAALAEALLARGADVAYLHGPGAQVPGRLAPVDVAGLDPAELAGRLDRLRTRALALRDRLARGRLALHPIETAGEAASTLSRLCRDLQPALVACAMAVADFAPVPHEGKLGSATGESGLHLHLRPTAKAIDAVKAAAPGCRLLGFKLLSGASPAELAAASRTLASRARCDWVFANDMADYRAGLRRGWLFAPDGKVLAALGGDGHGSLDDLAEALAAVITDGLSLP